MSVINVVVKRGDEVDQIKQDIWYGDEGVKWKA